MLAFALVSEEHGALALPAELFEGLRQLLGLRLPHVGHVDELLDGGAPAVGLPVLPEPAVFVELFEQFEFRGRASRFESSSYPAAAAPASHGVSIVICLRFLPLETRVVCFGLFGIFALYRVFLENNLLESDVI